MQADGRVVSRVQFLVAAVLLLAASAWSQSLGEAARQLRGQKRQQPKATRVYTNENLPQQGGLSTTVSESDKKGGEAAKAPAAEAGPSRAEVEREYRAKAAKLRQALAAEEQKLADLQRQWTLGRQQEVEQQKAAVEAAKKALESLEEDLRRKGLPPGLAR